MKSQVLVVPGSIVRLSADIIAYSTSEGMHSGGQMHPAFISNIKSFKEEHARIKRETEKCGRKVGDTLWIDLKGKKPRGVIITISRPNDNNKVNLSDIYKAVLNTLQFAREKLAGEDNSTQKLIALPCYLAGHGGSWKELKEIATLQMRATFDFIAENEEGKIDVAFVTYTDATYHAWTAARKSLLLEKGLGKHVGIDLPQDLVESIRRNECAVFFGSGISVNSGLPGWKELITELADELDIAPEQRGTGPDYFLDLAQWYRDSGKEPTVEKRLQARYQRENTGALPTIAHYLLASLPVGYFLTTNYDDLMECALEGLKRYPVRVISDTDTIKTGGRDDCYLIKPHGCATQDTGFVLSRDDYEDFEANKPATTILMESLLLTKSFFFVGYSLRDPDFRSINHRLAKILDKEKKTAYALTYDAVTPHVRKQWSSKNIELVEVEGETDADKDQSLMYILDSLLENVSENEIKYLGEIKYNTSDPRCKSYWQHLESIAVETVKELGSVVLAERGEIIAFAATVSHLASLGWRGREHVKLPAILQELAESPRLFNDDRKKILMEAMRYCESEGEFERIKEKIIRLEKDSG